MTEARERVDRGAALLDREKPGWYREIDLERLDIGEPADCVLGQTYGYQDGVSILRRRLDDYSFVPMHGFVGGSASYKDLNHFWREAIRLRLSVDSVQVTLVAGEREKESV